MTSSLLHRLFAAALVIGWVGLSAGPAVADDPFANYVTAVTSVSPAITGVTVRAQSDGAEMIATNSTATTLTILGYQDEPYLRVSTAGVWENEASPAAYLNKEYYIDAIPKSVNADAPPRWKRVASGTRAVWHDHRVHWMGAIEPPSVSQDPHHAHLIKTWTIAMVYGATPVTVTGTLSWHPGSRWAGDLPYFIGGAAVLLAIVIVVVGGRRRAKAVTGPA
jgi:hypothetical protein